ncbi:hypothetical protein FRC03_001568 [Tulasnella sp. 419]|nr:hypothetical protein FRC02_005965 [Tulasnella sp. 418]KAG8964604.1 hypothetical protein FRC03_001568 [Tulasnella sp. 419]
MFSKSTLLFGALTALVTSVNAVPEWQQCDGIGYTGSKTCDAGLTCVYVNDWYSQCQKASTTIRSSSSVRSSSSSSVRTTSTTSVRTTSVSTSTRTTSTSSRTTTGPTTTVSQGACPTGNPYTGYDVWLSPYYADEVVAAADQITDATLKAKALKVKDIPTFTWFDIMAKVPTLDSYLADARAQQQASGKKLIVQIVIYDLPDRDCHAKASNGELLISQGGEALYRQYIDDIAAIIAKYPDVRVVAVMEPDSLANLVTNMSDPRCANAATVYKSSTIYALKKLNFCNIWIYLDAGHAGWLGWPANLTPAAQLFTDIYKQSLPNRVRGLATNVANYNALSASSPDPVTSPNPNTDELKYINALGPVLQSNGFPAYFIVDQGRSGVQNIRDEWGNWCNIEGAGFGTRPTTNTGSSWIDAIVWIKPPGECDGTSNTSAVRYDSTCGLPDAKKPAPEAGQWFQAYFVDLVKFANPAL